jgi:branched-chain amino acid aminotransferase
LGRALNGGGSAACYDENVLLHRFVLHNDDLREASECVLAPGQVGVLSGWGVFSTIKVLDSVPFAFGRHWARMRRDAALMRVPFPADPEPLRLSLLRLLEANRARNATLRLMVVRNEGGMWQGSATGRSYDVIALTADLKNWSRGVKLRYVPHGRHAASRFAGAKMLSWAMNLVWLEEAQCDGFDEVILLNEHGSVSECTSANIFAALGGDVYTPPLSAGCLPGITRELLVSGEVTAAGYRVLEKDLTPDELESADEVFITSSTRDLLPVARIEHRQTGRDGRARAALQAEFSRYVDRYIAGHRQAAVG